MWLEILLFILLLFILFYLKITKNNGHWKSVGVKEPSAPSFPFGNSVIASQDSFLGKKHVNYTLLEQYGKTEGEKMYGTFVFGKPSLVVKDLDLVKQIMVKDFNHFTDHHISRLEEVKSTTDRIWAKQMFSASGEEWKDIRSTFSPVFTSGKIKAMMCFIDEVTKHLLEKFETERKAGNNIELKQTLGKFSMDSIASCAFGVNAQSFNESGKESEFVQNARSIFKRGLRDLLTVVFIMVPGGMKVADALGISIFKPKETWFFHDVILATLNNRKESGTRRNDLVDMLLDATKHPDTNEVEDAGDEQFEQDERLSHKSKRKDFDELTIVATALLFLIAGYDTTAMAMSYALYELTKNPDIQKKLQEEIDGACRDEHGNETPLDYTTITKLEYLDMVVHETLRKYPPLGLLTRCCTQDYTIPGTKVNIHNNEEIGINVYGIHHDPKIYPDPEKFDPERFSKENRGKRHPYAFLSFGQGPRACVAMRFALLEVKMALIALLSRYNFVRTEKTIDKVTFEPSAILSNSGQGLYAKVELRQK